MPVDTSIYNRPPPENPLQTIMNVGKAADTMGNFAVGKAVQGSMGADGDIDQNALAGLLKQSPVGAMKAIPTLDALAKLKQAGFAADAAGLETFQKRMAVTHHLFSYLASKDNPTMKDVYEVASMALDPALGAKKYGITMPVIMNAVTQFRGMNPQQIKKRALEMQSQAASTGEILDQHSPRHEVVDKGGSLEIIPTGTKSNPAIGGVVPKTLPPTTVVPSTKGPDYLGEQPATRGYVPPGGGGSGGAPDVGASDGGAPAAVPRAPVRSPTEGMPGANFDGRFEGVRPGPSSASIRTPVPTGPAAGLAPGLAGSMENQALAGSGMANQLTQAADGSAQRKAMLGNLEDDLTKFTSGQGADWTRVAKNFAGRNLPMPESWKAQGATFDQSSVAAQENFNKQAAMIAQQQFGTIGGTGTDAKFESAFTTSPNETLSQMGNKGIIRLLKGNEDAIQAKAKAWQKWKDSGKGPDTYAKFSLDFNQSFDPRAFQFKYLSQPERQAYIDAMDPHDKGEFIKNLTHARKSGWVTFDVPKKDK